MESTVKNKINSIIILLILLAMIMTFVSIWCANTLSVVTGLARMERGYIINLNKAFHHLYKYSFGGDENDLKKYKKFLHIIEKQHIGYSNVLKDLSTKPKNQIAQNFDHVFGEIDYNMADKMINRIGLLRWEPHIKKLVEFATNSKEEIVPYKSTVESLLKESDSEKKINIWKKLDEHEKLLNNTAKKFSDTTAELAKITKNLVVWGLLILLFFLAGIGLTLSLKISFSINKLFTQLYRQRQDLLESEAQLDAIFNSSFQFTGLIEPNGTLLKIKQTALNLLDGITREEVVNKPLWELHWWHNDEKRVQRLKTAINEAAQGKFVRYETDFMGVIFIDFSIKPFLSPDGRVTMLIAEARDITGRKRAEDEREKIQAGLFQSRKMESVGTLAGGVAHDYNNMLTVIFGHTQLAMNKIAPGDPLQANLKEIFRAASHSADITRQLLAFARKQTISPQILHLNEAVENILKMLRRLIGEDIDMTWLPGKHLDPVKVDPSQLDQILTNLCVNSRDAIDGVGKIIIETDNVRFDENYCVDHPGFIPGGFVMLTVSDNGGGMGKKTLDKAFEPFFTTKDVNKGTGLGLAMVYGIVKQSNGFINIYSEPGKGTTVRIYLPQHSGESRKFTANDITEAPLAHGETVLIVEDEASILELTKTVLEKLGYTVLGATTPDKAIEMAEQYAGQIQILITDVVLPKMNGKKLANLLHGLYPGLRILFMSGYTANIIAHHGVLDEGMNFIPKPFSNLDLAVKVRKVLDGPVEAKLSQGERQTIIA